jgi:hypothetical protein
MTTLAFDIAVSRRFKNKTGRGQRGFNNSFYTERHTLDSLAATLATGWPVTMVHKHAAPGEAARQRGVKTARITENFLSQQVIFLDDDRQQPGVVDSWLHDPFFCQYGAFFYESASSRPGAEKGRAGFILDRPITDRGQLKRVQKALMWRYPHVDQSTHDVTRIWYGAEGSQIHKIGQVLPWSVLEREVLQPYGLMLTEREVQAEQQRQQHRAELEKAQQEGRVDNDPGSLAHYLAKTLDGIFNFVAGQQHGRHRAIFWAGVKVGEFTAASWAAPHRAELADVDHRIIAAARANGYHQDHAHGQDSEVLRTFNDGCRLGETTPAPMPELIRPAAQPAQQPAKEPGEKKREKAARKAAVLAAAAARRAELEKRYQAAYAPGVVPFAIADDDEYRQLVVTARAAFGSAREWAEHVLLYFPELDAAHELAVKLTENREQRQDYCGRPVLKFMPDGSHEIGHWCCGYCDRCKHEQARLIKEKINCLTGSPSHPMEIIYFQVRTKEDRREWVRWFKAHELLYQVLPVGPADDVAYDILAEYTKDQSANLAKKFKEETVTLWEFVDPLTLGPAQLESWVNTPAGERRSGKLLGNIRELWKEFEHRPAWACDKDDPAACEIEIPGVVMLSSEIEPPACEEEVTSLEELQNALYDCHQRFVDKLIKRKSVILSVYSKLCYTPKTTVPALLADFNRRQAELRARQQRE